MRRALLLVAAGACLLALLSMLADVPAPLRVGATLAMFCLAPGAAALPVLAPRGVRIEPALILVTSLATLTCVAQAMLWFRAWGPATATYVLAGTCLFAIVVQLRSLR
jgi:hypothetical protein